MAAAPATESVLGESGALRAPRTSRAAQHPSSRAGSLAALLAIGSIPLHAWMLVSHPHGAITALLMGAMTLWCGWCAVGVLRSRAPAPAPARAVRHLWAMALAMTLLHTVLLTGFPVGTGAPHHGSAGGAGPAHAVSHTAGAGAGAGLMLAVLAVELAICFACAVALRADRTRHQTPDPNPPLEGNRP